MPILYTPNYPLYDTMVDHKCAMPSSEDAPQGTIYQCDDETCGKLYYLGESKYPVKTGLIWRRTNKLALFIIPIIHFVIIEFKALSPKSQHKTRVKMAKVPVSYYKNI
jgi:hypothetical protein